MSRFKSYSLILIGLISIIVTSDFLLFSETIKEPITNIIAKRQSYFNAAGNSHVSHLIETNNTIFNVTKEVAENATINDMAYYKLSPIFKKVNSYWLSPNHTETHSLRYFSGLILPILTLIVLFITVKLKKRLDILLFVICVLSLLNLVYLIAT